MTPDEDPEARIRQLEQGLAARASELGTNQPPPAPTSQLPPPVYGGAPPSYGSPPSYGDTPNYGSPPNYGDPYAAPPFGVSFPQGPRKSGAPVGLIIGLIAVFLVVVSGIIGVVVWNVTSVTEPLRTRPSMPSGMPGGGTIIPPTIPSIPIPVPDKPITPAGPQETVVQSGGQLSISGINESHDITCADGAINVSGINNTVNIKGHCVNVTVSGMNNQITVDSVDTIGASGFDNVITFHSGTPQIDATDSNTVQQG